MINSVRLYYTDGCHLCDDAIVLLEQLQVSYQKVDIIEDDGVEDDSLVALYGTLIPVVEKHSKATLNWPFSLQQLHEFIEEN